MLPETGEIILTMQRAERRAVKEATRLAAVRHAEGLETLHGVVAMQVEALIEGLGGALPKETLGAWLHQARSIEQAVLGEMARRKVAEQMRAAKESALREEDVYAEV